MNLAGIRSRLVRWPIAGEGAARGRTERAAILVEVTLASGAIGLGEAAPLPGTSTDTLEDAAAGIAAFAHRPGTDVEATSSAAAALAASITTSPSARFAIETAVLSAFAAETGRTLADMLAPSPVNSLPCAVVVDDPAAARRAVAAGARCLKIKVGPTGDLDRVIAIHHAAPHATLRIDANQTWSRALTRPLLHALADLPVDFVEEPCPDAHELLAEPLPCTIALDESLTTLTDEQLAIALRSPGLCALVLKPTLLGGHAACLALAARAAAAGKDVVVTHALEGPIGTGACAELALAIAGLRTAEAAAGLAPHAALVGWSHAAPLLEATRILRVQSVASPRLDEIREPMSAGSKQPPDSAAVDAAPQPEAANIRRVQRVASPRLDELEPMSAGIKPPADSAASPTAAAVDGTRPSVHAARPAATVDAASPAGSNPPADSAATVDNTRASILVATPTTATVEAIRAALDARQPLTLLHHRLPAAELARQRDLVEAVQLPAGTAFVLFTSGSTGPARGVVLSRTAIDAAAAASAAHLGWRSGDHWLLALSTAHAGGLAIVVRCHLAGVPIALLDGDFDRARCAELLRECTLASLVPTQLAALLEDPAWRPPPQLRAVLLGGAAASPALLARAAERAVPFLTSYGLTETFGQIATVPAERAGQAGAPLRLLAGVEVVAGTPDEAAPIEIRAPMLATAYLDGQAIAPRFVTADLGFVVDEVLHVVGRIDDVIVSGGEKVHPSVVEAELAATPGVRGACVFGVPDARWGHTVGAVIAVEDGFDEELAAVRWTTTLAPHARPRELAIAEALPLLPSGKVDRQRASLLARRVLRYPR